MNSTFDSAAELINNAKLAADYNNKVTFLQQVAELAVRKEPAILNDILPEVLLFQVETNASVRRQVCLFVAEALRTASHLSGESLQQIAAAMLLLARDPAGSVVKEAVGAWRPLLPAALTSCAAHPGDKARGAAWLSTFEGTTTVVELGLQHETEAIRLRACKVIEAAVLLFTDRSAAQVSDYGSPAQPLPSTAQLAKESDRMLRMLLEFLKQPSLETLRGVLMVWVLKGLTEVAVKRPNLVGRILPDMLALVGSKPAVLQTPHRIPSDHGGRPIVTTIGAQLCSALQAIRNSRHDTVAAWQTKLHRALSSLDAVMGPADTSNASKSRARPDGDTGTYANKRARVDGAAAANEQRCTGGVSRVDDATLRQVRMEVIALLQSPTATPVADTVLEHYGPVMLADLVIANLIERLPEEPPTDPDAKATAPTTSAPAVEPSAASSIAPAKDAAAGSQVKAEPKVAAAAPDNGAGKEKEEARPAKMAQRMVRRAPPNLPSLQPAPLNPFQLRSLRHMAVQRLLSASAATVQTFRQPLLARLAAKAPPSDGIADIVLEYIVEDYQGRGGHDLVMTWLYSLFITHCGAEVKPPGQPAGESATGPSEGGEADTETATGQQGRDQPHTGMGLRSREGDEQERNAEGQGQQERERAEESSRLDAAAEAKVSARQPSEVEGLEPSAAGLINREAMETEGGGLGAGEGAGRTVRETQDAPAEPMDVQEEPDVEQSAQGRGEPMLPPEPSCPEGASPSTCGADKLGSGSTPDLTNTPYEVVLLAVLEALRERLPPKDKSLTVLLLEAPALPMPSVCGFLRDVLRQGDEWASLALRCAREVLMQRPPSRQAVLQVVLEAAVDEDAYTRDKAVRLLTNNLARINSLHLPIHDFALKQLKHLPRHNAVTAEKEGAADAGAVAEAVGEVVEVADAGDEAAAERLCGLYMSLCTQSHAMLPALFKAYAATTPPAQLAMNKAAENLARAIGFSPHLKQLVQEPPAGSLPLLVHMLHVLGEEALAPEPLVDACMERVRSDNQLQLAAAVMPALSKSEVMRLLPRLLPVLSKDVLMLTLKRLTISPPQPALLTPAELLHALLVLDSSKEGVSTKVHMAAVDNVIHMSDVFSREAVAQAIQQAEGVSPLPQLFMRCVIQALSVHPKLRDFVLSLLARLITRHIWTIESQWQGFLIVIQRFAPHTFPIFLQLPPQVLEDTLLSKSLNRHLQDFALKLARWVKSPSCEPRPLRAVADIMDAVINKLAPVLAAAGSKDSGGGSYDGGFGGATGGSSVSYPAGVSAKRPGRGLVAGVQDGVEAGGGAESRMTRDVKQELKQEIG